MEKEIKVNRLIKNGLTEKNGLILREQIEKNLLEVDENDIIILNFEGIELFATPFFNSSIGYFILKWGQKKYDKLIKLSNISELGKNTFQHSYDNAIEMYDKKIDESTIGQITKVNIENS